MLVKSHDTSEKRDSLLEDFGLLNQNVVHFYENGDVDIMSLKGNYSQVIRVNAMWVNRNLTVRCEVADTTSKKRIGLQGHKKLGAHEGMYFPYERYTDVTFHQGSVPFSLDLLFIADNIIQKIEPETRVGSSERWSCRDCDGVIEVNGGFCYENSVFRGDKVALFAVTQQDLDEIQRERCEAGFLTVASELCAHDDY